VPRPIMNGPVCVAHLVPIAGLAGKVAVNMQEFYDSAYLRFAYKEWSGNQRRTFSLDGLTVSDAAGGFGYNHIFRNGAMEGAFIGGREMQLPNGDVGHVVWGSVVANFFWDTVHIFLKTSKELGIDGPAVLHFALLDVDGYTLDGSGAGQLAGLFSKALADRNYLLLPDAWIENMDTADVSSIVRPLLDTLWQSFGRPACPYFDGTGQYVRPQ